MKPAVLAALCATSLFAAGPQPYFSEPSISPGRLGDRAGLGRGYLDGPVARRAQPGCLISNPATEFAPHYSPDGKYLAFSSMRTGNGDVYLLTFASGELKRLTFDDSGELVEGWSPDSRWVYFSSTARDISGMNDIYRVSREGGTPMQVSADRYTTEYFAAPAPDGRTLAFTARGMAGSQWWRKGHSHLDESEIWLRREGTPGGIRARDGRRRQGSLADVGARRQEPLLHVRPQRRTEHLAASAGRRSGPADHQIHRRPGGLALDFGRRARHRLRTRFPHLEARPEDR